MQSSGNVFRQSSLSSHVRKINFTSLFFLFVCLLTLFPVIASSDEDIKIIKLIGQVVDRTLPPSTKICLDISGNRKCDPDEPSGRTDVNGIYILIIPAERLGNFPIVVESDNKEIGNLSSM